MIAPDFSWSAMATALRRAVSSGHLLKENQRLRRALADAEAASARRIHQEKARLEKANAKLKQLAVTDDVTGLYNQRFLAQWLGCEVKRWDRYGGLLSAVLLDLDRFKAVNDGRGHLFGSRVIGRVGALLRRSVREVDMCVRYGGDEFVVLLPGTPLDGAQILAERLLSGIRAADFGDGEDPCSLTASIGVAQLGVGGAVCDQSLLHAADRAMYLAKERGRARVIVMDDALGAETEGLDMDRRFVPRIEDHRRSA